MGYTLSDGLKVVGSADWAPIKRVGNTAVTGLCQQHNAMLATTGGPMCQCWDCRETSTDGAIGPIMRLNVPDVPSFRVSVIADYTGSEGDGGTVTAVFADGSGTISSDTVNLVNGVAQYLLEIAPGSSIGVDYYLYLEWALASGEDVTHHGTCASPMVLTTSPVHDGTYGGSVHIEDEEYADTEALTVDLMARMLQAPKIELASRCGHYLQHWGVAGDWTAARGRYVATSHVAVENWQGMRIRSTGKKFKVLVQGYGSAGTGSVTVTIAGESVAVTISSTTAPTAYDERWHTGTSSAAVAAGYHTMNVLITPPSGGTLYVYAITVYEVLS